MKNKILLALLLATVTTSSMAWYRGPHYGCGGCWVAPAIVGGVVGYELARPETVVIQQPPVYVTQPSVVQQPPVGFHWQEMIDPQTNMKKIVLVPN